MKLSMHPALLDQLYHWAEDKADSAAIEITMHTPWSLTAKQGEREHAFSLVESVIPQTTMLDNSVTYGPGWPD